MSALATRAHLHGLEHCYLSPLPQTGKTATQMPVWIQQGLDGSRELRPVFSRKLDNNGEQISLGQGYEFTRTCSIDQDEKRFEWEERVLLICSSKYRETLSKNLKKRLATATEKLEALTPAPARGKRQIRDAKTLEEKAETILTQYKVQGLLRYHSEREEKVLVQYIGQGRGSENRKKKQVTQVRYQITSVERREDAITELEKTLGWKAYVTNESPDQLSFENAVLTYRDEWTIERGFHRLKGAPLSLDPVFVKRNDQVEGLTNLLSIALRALTLIEFVVRRG
ncbi:transposase, partial [Desulforhopalus vacuolatus]|uniref:IS1634 family transposase n=1 Tax=Desulforhopalus vacuolatus TaxID=40414 RepID=UPI001964BC80